MIASAPTGANFLEGQDEGGGDSMSASACLSDSGVPGGRSEVVEHGPQTFTAAASRYEIELGSNLIEELLEFCAIGEKVSWRPIWELATHKRQTRRLISGVARLALTSQDPKNRAVPAFAVR